MRNIYNDVGKRAVSRGELFGPWYGCCCLTMAVGESSYHSEAHMLFRSGKHLESKLDES